MILKNFYQKNALFFAGLALGFLLYPHSASAEAVYNSLVPIPGIPNGAGVTVYLGGLYSFLISVVGVVAMGAIVIGGARYLTSVGNPSAIEDAKHTINSAIYGLLLAITSWVIVKEINPDILVLKKPEMKMSVEGLYRSSSSTPRCDVAGTVRLGTEDSKCSCVDGAEIASSFGNKATKITLTAAPATGTVSITGSLKDVAGTPLATGTSFELTRVNSSLNRSHTTVSYTIGASGAFNQAVGTTCNATEYWEVIFRGNATHAPSSSGPIEVNTTGSASSCVPTDYVVNPAIPPFSPVGCNAICSDASLAKDGKSHCGSKFLVVRLDTKLDDDKYPDTAVSQNTVTYIIPEKSQMYEFQLKDSGITDRFKITASSYTADSKTYDCAILISDETAGANINKAIWVKTGAMIKANGVSMESDIGEDNYNDTCPYGNSACDTPFLTFDFYDTSKALSSFYKQRGAIKIFKTQYSSPMLNFCMKDAKNNCLAAKSGIDYRPNANIVCDPGLKKWISR